MCTAELIHMCLYNTAIIRTARLFLVALIAEANAAL